MPGPGPEQAATEEDSANAVGAAIYTILADIEAAGTSVKDSLTARKNAFTEHITDLNNRISDQIASASGEEVRAAEAAPATANQQAVERGGVDQDLANAEAGLISPSVLVGMAEAATADAPEATQKPAAKPVPKTPTAAWDYVKAVWTAAAHSTEIAEARLKDTPVGTEMDQLERLTGFLSKGAMETVAYEVAQDNSLGEKTIREKTMCLSKNADGGLEMILVGLPHYKASEDPRTFGYKIKIILANCSEETKKKYDLESVIQTATAYYESDLKTSAAYNNAKKNNDLAAMREIAGRGHSGLGSYQTRIYEALQRDKSIVAMQSQVKSYFKFENPNQAIIALAREAVAYVYRYESGQELYSEDKIMDEIYEFYKDKQQVWGSKASYYFGPDISNEDKAFGKFSLDSKEKFKSTMKKQLDLIPDLSKNPMVRTGLVVAAVAIACATMVLCPPLGIPLTLVCGFAVASGVFSLGLLATKKLPPLFKDKKDKQVDMAGKMLAALTLAYGKGVNDDTLALGGKRGDRENKAIEYLKGYKATLVRPEASLVAVLAIAATISKMPGAVTDLVVASAHKVAEETVAGGKRLDQGVRDAAVAAAKGMADGVEAVRKMPSAVAETATSWVDRAKKGYNAEKARREKAAGNL